jgi:hypothetical protein
MRISQLLAGSGARARSAAAAAPRRLLVTASSNTAADIFVTNLAGVLSTAQMIRVNAYQRPARDVSPVVLAYSGTPVGGAGRGSDGGGGREEKRDATGI